ncbi:MAG: alanine racemase [Clostridia bacterium]|nr:alanine racemase [Clostridia bacterium]
MHCPDMNMRVCACIDRGALVHNYTVLSQGVTVVSPSCVPVCVVKANAYGHGAESVAKSLWQAGCRHFAVATLEEAMALASAFESVPALLLVLGYTPPEGVAPAAAGDITLTAVSRDHAEAMAASAANAGVTVKCHVALDTGMNRIGFPAHNEDETSRTVEDVAYVMKLKGLSVTGMFTHFALADEDEAAAIAADSHTMTQYARYRGVYDQLVARGLRPAFCHVCNSAAAIRLPQIYPDVCFDGVRFGISLYGYGVSPAIHHSYTLRPVMKLTTRVVHLHTLLPGEIVSYGGRFKADTPRTIATLPIGYADGFRRGFEGGLITIRTSEGDKTAPLVGRICMDQCMADVTDLPVKVGDEVMLFGDDCPAYTAPQLSLEALCDRANTIPYEILCQITPRVPRVNI